MNNEYLNPTQRVLNALAESGNQATRSGSGWSARCPAHDDRNPSLSISEGSEGNALVHCHAGCGFDDIVEAIGLGRSDLYQADSGGTGHRPPRPSSKATGSSSAHYGGVCEAMAVLESRLGTSTHTWEYHDAQGELVDQERDHRLDSSRDRGGLPHRRDPLRHRCRVPVLLPRHRRPPDLIAEHRRSPQ